MVSYAIMHADQLSPDVRPLPPAHIEDSLAVAEQLQPETLAEKIRRAKLRECNAPGQLLARAWLRYEYALATPNFTDDGEQFAEARADLRRIMCMKHLSPRNKYKLNAGLLLAYERPFEYRATHPNSLIVPRAMSNTLQREAGHLMLNYLEGPEPTSDEYGNLSELIAITYLLNGDLFPYLTSWREENNMIKADNHDVYTLHPCARNRIKKAPGSIKYRERTQFPGVVTLTIGELAVATAKQIPPYCNQPGLEHKDSSRSKAAWATRLAADIMVCHTTDDTLSVEDKAFL